MEKQQKSTQRVTYANGYNIYVGLNDDLGYISIVDNNLYFDSDGQVDRSNLIFNTMTIPRMTMEQLKNLHTNIDEILKMSK